MMCLATADDSSAPFMWRAISWICTAFRSSRCRMVWWLYRRRELHMFPTKGCAISPRPSRIFRDCFGCSRSSTPQSIASGLFRWEGAPHKQDWPIFCTSLCAPGGGRIDRGQSFHLPLTQAILADVLGLSTVHVNRVLQRLRKNGLVTWRNDLITIEDWPQLCALAEFDPTYLCLHKEPR